MMKVAIGVVRRGPRRRHRRRGLLPMSLVQGKAFYFSELKVRSHACPLNEFCTPLTFVDV